MNPLSSRGLAFVALLSMSLSALPTAAFADEPRVATELAPPDPAPLGPSSASATAVVASEPSSEPVEFLQVAHPSRLAAFLFGGVAVAGLGVGIGFGVAALHDKSNYDPATSPASKADLTNQNSVISDVGFGAAVIAGVTSVLLFLRHDDEPPPPKDAKALSALSFSITPTAGPHGAGAGAVLRF